MLMPHDVRSQMKDHFLHPANKQLSRLQKYGPYIIGYKNVSGNRMVILNDKSWIPETHYEVIPDVYFRQLVQDFWRQFELTCMVIQHPFSYMGLRSLYEHAYKKMLVYINSDENKKRSIATKSWLCTLAMFMVRVTDGSIHNLDELRKYNELLELLNGDDKNAFKEIRDDNFPNENIHAKMNRLFGRKGVPSLIRNYSDSLTHPILGSPPIEVIIANYNLMHGYSHLNTAHTSYSGLIIGEQKHEHLRRIRSSLSLVAYQMLCYVNQTGLVPETDINRANKFIRTIGKNAEKELV